MRKGHKFVFLILLNCVVLDWVHGQYYTSNCSGTFDPFSLRRTIYTHSYRKDPICEWTMKAPPGEKFALYFKLPFRHQNLIEVWDGNTRLIIVDDDDHDNELRTKSNYVRILHDTRRQRKFVPNVEYVTVHAKLLTDRLYYTHHNETQLSWLKAQEYCEQDGGSLAEILPVRPEDLIYDLNGLEELTWTGLSMTRWTWAHGCVYWGNSDGIEPTYSKSKYNQMSECSSACRYSKYFLLKGSLCFCLNKDSSTTKTSLRSCDDPCPGDVQEICGGKNNNIYTLYEHYKGPSVKGTGLKNCMWTSANLTFIPTECDDRLEFTCEFQNSSSRHFYVNETWIGAWKFCNKLESSVGLKNIPTFQSSHNKQWAGVIRKMDWNFPTVTRRNPEYSFTDSLHKSSEAKDFVCQHEYVTCGDNYTSDNGTINKFDANSYYNINELCIWSIEVNATMVVEIDLRRVDLEDSDQCIYDYIQIWDYPMGEKRRFCGTQTASLSFSTQTSLVAVVFNSDRSITGQGFILKWKAVEPMIEIDDMDESIEGKKGLSGAGIVGVTMALTVTVLALVAFVIVLRVRRSRLMKAQATPVNSLGGMSNAIYSDGSDFSTASNTYQNAPLPERRIAPEFRNFCNSIDVRRYENVNNLGLGQGPGHPTKLKSVTEDSPVQTMTDIDKLGLDCINVVDSDDSAVAPETHYYSSIADGDTCQANEAGNQGHNGSTSIYNETGASIHGGHDERNMSVLFSDVNIYEDEDGYLEPRSPHAGRQIYSEIK